MDVALPPRGERSRHDDRRDRQRDDVAVDVALRLGTEIISADSMAVYRRMEVATAKPSAEQRARVPHHLIDVADPTENVTAGAWARMAAATIREIESRGRTAILVGGTGFYLRALVEGLFDAPDVDPRIRRRLGERLERRGAERLHRLLGRLDPEAAERVAPRDWSRVVRALELRLTTGRTASALLRESPPRPPDPDIAARVRILALAPPRDALYERIDRRTVAMFEAGLVDEVRALLDAGLPPNAKALGAHGYRRVVEHLRGKRSLESAVEQTRLDTRHYAKRQWTWWRATPGVHWIEAFGVSDRARDEALLYLENRF